MREQENNLPKGRGYGVFFENGKVHFNLVSVWADDSFRVETEKQLPIRQWHHMLAVFDSLEPYDKVTIYMDGQKQTLKINNGRLFRQFAEFSAHLRIGARSWSGWNFRGLIDEVRIYKALPNPSRLQFSRAPIRFHGSQRFHPQKRTEAQR